MHNRSIVACLTVVIALIIILSGTSVTAVGPGSDNGTLGLPDTYWLANPGWSTVYQHNDADQGTWWTGISFWDVYYFDAFIQQPQDNSYDYYIKEITIPWIGIKMANGNMVYYEHSDDAQAGGTMTDHLMVNGPWNGGNFNGYAESNNQPNVATSLVVSYDLDINDDDTKDFTFEEYIDLQGAVVAGFPGGWMMAKIQATSWPQNNRINIPGYGWDTVDEIEYVFLFDADVYGDSDNEIYYWNNGWTQQATEAAFTTTGNANGDVAYISNPNEGQALYVKPLRVFQAQSTEAYYALAYQGNEYSQHPSDYLNNEDIDDEDGLIWCVLTIDVSGGQPNGWDGFQFRNFQA